MGINCQSVKYVFFRIKLHSNIKFKSYSCHRMCRRTFIMTLFIFNFLFPEKKKKERKTRTHRVNPIIFYTLRRCFRRGHVTARFARDIYVNRVVGKVAIFEIRREPRLPHTWYDDSRLSLLVPRIYSRG